ncbi:dynamin family protein [Jeotgalibacillus proteolyticus]|uniref:dynamin family protein n=1 Tax=Jeotgalibacillus proteolyticus TaxID=2082395 RepID=UPI003CEED9EF
MIEQMQKKISELNEVIQRVTEDDLISTHTKKSMKLHTLSEKLDHGTFKIGVVAPFSVGKSTFMNSLLEYDLLSTSILVETATITTVKYGERPKIIIHYREGGVQELPEREDEVYSLEDLKREMKRYTAVNRTSEDHSVEKTIKEVELFWPIDLCKDGVEIVDTPGLFAQYAEHQNITQRLLLDLNAIIFLIDPTTVGEQNFMRIIREYAERAKNSTMDGEGKHIFFAVNKIDQHPEAEVDRAVAELEKVLSEVITNPQIFKVSSYFGVISALFNRGEITIDDIRKDETIKFKDDEGYTVSGRGIMPEDLTLIRKKSNIDAVKNSMGEYFEQKHAYLLEDVISTLVRTYRIEKEEAEKTSLILQQSHTSKKEDILEKIDLLKGDFDKKIRKTSKQIEKELNDQVFGGSSTTSDSLLHNVTKYTMQKAPLMTSDWERKARKSWRVEKFSITKYDAQDKINGFSDFLDLSSENVKQTISQQVYEIAGKKLKYLIKDGEERFGVLEADFHSSFNDVFDLQESETVSFINFDELLRDVIEELNKSFVGNSVHMLRSNLSDKVKQAEGQATTRTRKRGFFNTIKSFFGKAEYENEFNESEFEYKVDQLVEAFIETVGLDLEDDVREMSKQLNQAVPDAASSIIKEKFLTQKLSDYKTWREEQISLLESQYHSNETEINTNIQQMIGKIERLEKSEQEIQALYLHLTQKPQEAGVSA